MLAAYPSSSQVRLLLGFYLYFQKVKSSWFSEAVYSEDKEYQLIENHFRGPYAALENTAFLALT